jgi:hypothetical protein
LECINKDICHGGEIKDNSDELCMDGHVGALCKECDILNLKGNGSYTG